MTQTTTATMVMKPDYFKVEPVTMLKKIGSTNYKVAVHFSATSKENINDKIMRLIKNDLNFNQECATIGLPQIETERYRRAALWRVFARTLGKNHEEWLPERSSL